MNTKINKENFEIQIKVDNEEELYNKFDETKSTLNSKLISYIEENLNKKNVFDNLIIIVTSPSNIDENQFKKAFEQYVKDKILLNQKRNRFNKLKQIRLLIIGFIFIIISTIIATLFNSVIYTIISTIGSFAIWEASNIWIVENMDSKIEKKILTSLLKATIEVKKQ